MLNLVAADLIVLLHLGFIIFVIIGGFLVFKWWWIAWIHIPCVIWGAVIELAGWICPLTPVENMFRHAGGGPGYTFSFIEHYILPVIYPTALTRELQILIGVVVIVINVGIYVRLYFLRTSNKIN